MIDLAPNHKIGLAVANPILLAGGSIGYGEAFHPGLAIAKMGAVVVGPLLLHSRAGSAPPRLKQVEQGFVLDSGLQNRGLDATVRNFSRLWGRLGCPVVVQVAEPNPRSIPRIVLRLEAIEHVAGIELWLAQDVDIRTVKNLIRAVVESCDLPLWVKLPLDRAVELAPICVQNEAAALVVGTATAALLTNPGVEANGLLSTGNLYGPVVFPHMLEHLQSVANLQLDCALIACGGIYTPAHVQQALAAGAVAVQIDSAVWVEPGLPEHLLQEINRTPMI